MEDMYEVDNKSCSYSFNVTKQIHSIIISIEDITCNLLVEYVPDKFVLKSDQLSSVITRLSEEVKDINISSFAKNVHNTLNSIIKPKSMKIKVQTDKQQPTITVSCVSKCKKKRKRQNQK